MITRDVAYGSVPYALRTSLHGRLAGYIEAKYDDTLSGYVDLLAYHYDLSSDQRSDDSI